jgi:hypothetical protein
MDFSFEEKNNLLSVIKNNQFDQAFDVITSSNWWDDNTVTQDLERERFLYQIYFEYHDILNKEGVKNFNYDYRDISIAERNHDMSPSEKMFFMNRLKSQLDIELKKVRDGIYESSEAIKV